MENKGPMPMTGESGSWNNGLFDCFSGGLCLKGCCCPCFVYGKTQHRLRDPTLQNYESMNTDCLLWCGIQSFLGCGWIFSCMQRGDIRSRYNLPGGGCGDCCATFCCTACVVIQNEKEVMGRTEGNAMGVMVQQGYQRQEGMVVPHGQMQHQGM